jgi:hypothetical protein
LRRIAVLFLLLIAVVALLFVPRAAADAPQEQTAIAFAQPIHEEKPKEPELPPVLLDIAWAESGDTQYGADGEALIGITGDIGRWQINPIHLPEAKKLGLDIYTEAGNRAFALVLYNRNGTRDWNPSRYCWSDIVACKKARGYINS